MISAPDDGRFDWVEDGWFVPVPNTRPTLLDSRLKSEAMVLARKLVDGVTDHAEGFKLLTDAGFDVSYQSISCDICGSTVLAHEIHVNSNDETVCAFCATENKEGD